MCTFEGLPEMSINNSFGHRISTLEGLPEMSINNSFGLRSRACPICQRIVVILTNKMAIIIMKYLLLLFL